MTTRKLKKKSPAPKKAILIGDEEMPEGYFLDGDIREFKLAEGLPGSISEMAEEVQDMIDVLLGRQPAPINEGIATLLEVADAYFGRASEMAITILALEREGRVKRNDPLYKFRTGELRTFMDMAKKMTETGSRRITMQQLAMDALRRGLDSEGME